MSTLQSVESWDWNELAHLANSFPLLCVDPHNYKSKTHMWTPQVSSGLAWRS